MKNLNFNGFMCVLKKGNRSRFLLVFNWEFWKALPTTQTDISGCISIFFFSNLFFFSRVTRVTRLYSLLCQLIGPSVTLSFSTVLGAFCITAPAQVFFFYCPVQPNANSVAVCPALFSVCIINWALPSWVDEFHGNLEAWRFNLFNNNCLQFTPSLGRLKKPIYTGRLGQRQWFPWN